MPIVVILRKSLELFVCLHCRRELFICCFERFVCGFVRVEFRGSSGFSRKEKRYKIRGILSCYGSFSKEERIELTL